MADLLDHQWELGGVLFGIDCRVQSDPDVQPPSGDIRNQDSISPIADAIRMGRDRKTPDSWAFKLFVDEDSEETALDALDELGAVWDAEEVRSTIGRVMELRYALGGRVRKVYGRPRRWTPTLNNALLNGYIPITADFKLVSSLFFDDEEQTLNLGANPAISTGGFDVPFMVPIEFVGSSVPVEQQVVIGGRRATPVTVEFHGPSVDPVVTIEGTLDAKGQPYTTNPPSVRIPLIGEIPDLETVTIDGRPWINSATRGDGAAVAGSMLSRTFRFDQLSLPQGTYRVTHTSKDTSGRAGATVRWHNAHSSV